jgi:hypothetical protein
MHHAAAESCNDGRDIALTLVRPAGRLFRYQSRWSFAPLMRSTSACRA